MYFCIQKTHTKIFKKSVWWKNCHFIHFPCNCVNQYTRTNLYTKQIKVRCTTKYAPIKRSVQSCYYYDLFIFRIQTQTNDCMCNRMRTYIFWLICKFGSFFSTGLVMLMNGNRSWAVILLIRGWAMAFIDI